MERGSQEVGITREDIQERDPLKKKLKAHQAFQEKPKLRTCRRGRKEEQ